MWRSHVDSWRGLRRESRSPSGTWAGCHPYAPAVFTGPLVSKGDRVLHFLSAETPRGSPFRCHHPAPADDDGHAQSVAEVSLRWRATSHVFRRAFGSTHPLIPSKGIG